jgi:O-antigen ligase
MQADITGATVTLTLFVWPCLVWLKRQGHLWQLTAMALLTAFLVGVSQSGASALAFIGAGLTVVIGLSAPRLAVTFPALILALGFMAAPFLHHLHALLRWPNLLAWLQSFAPEPRIQIWTFYRDLFWQSPWHGFGFRAEQALDTRLFTPLLPSVTSLHPHNQPLQILFEFGVVGAALVFATMAALTCSLYRDGRPQTAAAVAPLVAFLAAGLVNFGLWELWWTTVGSIALVFSYRLLKGDDLTSPAPVQPSV